MVLPNFTIHPNTQNTLQSITETLRDSILFTFSRKYLCARPHDIDTRNTGNKAEFWKFICETIVYVQICLKIMSKVLVIVAGFRFGRGWFRYSLLNYLQKLWKVMSQNSDRKIKFNLATMSTVGKCDTRLELQNIYLLYSRKFHWNR